MPFVQLVFSHCLRLLLWTSLTGANGWIIVESGHTKTADLSTDGFDKIVLKTLRVANP